MKATVSAASVHGEGFAGKPIETFLVEMHATLHRPNDPGERDDLVLLAAHKGVAFEEGDHPLEEVLPPPNDQHIGVIVRLPMVLPERAAANALSDQVQYPDPSGVLAHAELRHELPTASRTWVPLQRNVKAAFSVDKSRDVGIQSFLLINRTCRIVTAPLTHGRTLRGGCNTGI